MTKRLLIADDDGMMRELFLELGNLAGYETQVVSNGQQAVDNAEYADIIILDCDMPVKDGLGALVEIREKYPEKQVIMTTGDFTPERDIFFREHGVYDCLKKPFDSTNFNNTLYRCSNIGSDSIEKKL